MRKKLFTFLLALVTSVGLSWATVITWDASKVSSMAMNVSSGSDSRTSDGITVTAVSTGEFVVFGDYGGAIEIGNGEGSGGGYLTFTSSVGNIAQIDINHSGAGEWRNANGDWISPYYVNFEGGIFTWSGTPAASITLTGDAPRYIYDITSIEFTIEDGGGSTPAGLQVTELQVSPSWADNPTMLSTSDMPGFSAVSYAEAAAWDAAPAGEVALIFAFEGNGATSLSFKNGVYQAAQAHNITYEDLYAWYSEGEKIFYTGGGSTPATGLQVVEVTSDIYDGWNSNSNTFTVDALPGFQAVTFDEAKEWTGVPTSGTAALVYRTNGDYARVIHFFDGDITGDYDLETSFNQMYENITIFGNRIFYTAGGGSTPDPTPDPEPTPSGDGDKLAGAFSVGGDKVVYFSKANLQATTADNGSTWTWGFAENQWDYVGNSAANNAINGGGTVSTNGAVDLFAWSSTDNNYFGINNSINEADYSGDFKDWGAKMGSDWRTLTINEWQYLLQERNPGSSSANYTSYPRYTNAQILTDGTAPQKDINGIILFPDDFNDGGESIDGVTWGSINPSFFSSYTTYCTTAGWATLESMGCVFLPSAGSRQKFGDEFAMVDVAIMGNYWSSTLSSGEPEDPQSIVVGNGTLGIGTNPRYFGMSVRLVSETAPSGGSTPTPTVEANIFNYKYDCYRIPSYPKKNSSCNVYNFENEVAGPWKVEFVENLDRNSTTYQVNDEALWYILLDYYDNVPGYWETDFAAFVDAHPVPVFNLYQWNGSAYELMNIGYVLAYANLANTTEHAAVFRTMDGSSFRYFTDQAHGVYDDFGITFDSDLTDGLSDLVPAPVVPTDQELADVVIGLINAIPNPVAYNDDCKIAIDAARAAYDALNAAQKDLVENYGDLLDAETAYAQSIPHPNGECGAQGDNLLWDFNPSTGVLTITGSGAMADWHDDTKRPWYSYYGQITSVVLPEGLTTIGEKAFKACDIVSINTNNVLPSTLTTIKQEGFCGINVTNITIPASVVLIEQDAFYLSGTITDVYCYADPNNLTWGDYWCDDFISSPKKTTQCHVKSCYLDVFNSKWNTGNSSTDINVTYVGDLPGDCTPAVDPAVQDVIDLIDAIGSVTYTQACKDKIDAARDAYDALNADQKALVSNYSTLTDAEAAYAALIPVVTNYSISLDGITENADKVTLNNASAAEGETITLTPAAGYQITAFTASYASAYSVRVTADPSVDVYEATPYVGALPKEFTENVTPGLNGATFHSIEGDDPFTPVPASVLEYVSMNAAKDQMTIRVNDAFSGIIRVNYTYNVENCEWDEYEQQEICMGGTAQASVRVVCEAAGGVAPASKDAVTGAYSFTMPAGNVTITATVEAIPAPTAAVIGDPNNASEVETFLTTYDGQTIDELIIDRPVYNNMYNTLCLPFDMNATQIAASSLNGVEIREFTGASVEGTTLNLSVGDPVNAVVAGRPYFVKYSAASQLDDLHFEDVTINNALLDNMAVTFDGVTFKGTFTPFVMPNGLNFQGGYLFLGQNNQLFWPNTSNPLKPFRAYFYVNVESSTPGNAPKYRGMPARIVEGKNVATGVENAQSANQSTKVIVNGQLIIIKNDVRYNAQGQIVK